MSIHPSDVEYYCPHCKKVVYITKGQNLDCPHCSKNVEFTGEALERLQDEVDDLSKQLARINHDGWDLPVSSLIDEIDSKVLATRVHNVILDIMFVYRPPYGLIRPEVISDFRRVSKKSLSRRRGMGKKSMKALEDALEKHGIRMKE